MTTTRLRRGSEIYFHITTILQKSIIGLFTQRKIPRRYNPQNNKATDLVAFAPAAGLEPATL